MDLDKETTRMTFDVPKETHASFVKHIPYGLRKYAYRAIMEGFGIQLERNPAKAITLIVTYANEYNQLLEDALNRLTKVSKESSGK